MTDQSGATKYHWEDLTVGTVIEAGSVQVEREEALEFARRYDPQPFHLDDAAAAHSIFGRLAISGWMTGALAMGLVARNFLNQSTGMGSPGLEQIKWLKPVYPGDRLTVTVHVTASRPMRSRPAAGLIRSEWRAFNQDGEQVMLIDGWSMFGRRNPEPSST